VEGAVESALDAALVTAQRAESVPTLALAVEDAGEALIEGQVDVVPVYASPFIDQAHLEEAGFQGAQAGKAPGGHGDLLDQDGFDGPDGLEVIKEGLESLVEEGGVLAGDDGEAGGEAVLEGIEGGGGFALGGFGAGAELGVGAVGVDLFLRGHKGG